MTVETEHLEIKNGILQVYGVRAFALGPWAWCISSRNKDYFSRNNPTEKLSVVVNKLRERYWKTGMSYSSIVLKPEEFVCLYLKGLVGDSDIQGALITDSTIVVKDILMPFLGDGPTMHLIVSTQ